MWGQKNRVTRRRSPNYVWFHPAVLQGPFTRWVNNKLKQNTSHLYFIFSITFRSSFLYPNFKKTLWDHGQGLSEGTSSVAFEVLIINCEIYFINSFIFNCLILNIKLFVFKFFDVKSLTFSENHVFRKQKRTAVYGVMDARP